MHNSREMNCETIKEQLAAYALGALAPDEEQRVTQHLQHCPECTTLLHQYQEVAATLPELMVDPAQHSLPPVVKERLLQRIEMEEIQASLGAKSSPSPTASSTNPIRRWFKWPALAGTAVLIIALLWWAQSNLFSTQMPDGDLQAILQQQALIQEIVESDETLQFALEPQEDELAASGRLYTNLEKETLVLTATGLPKPSEGEGYFVWYGSDEIVELAGSLIVNDDGFGLLVFESDEQETMQFAQIAIQPVNDLTTGKLVLRWTKEE